MTDHLRSPSSSGGPSAAVEEQSVAMWDADDQPDPGGLSGTHMSPAPGGGPASDRSLRKRKRNVTGDPSARPAARFDHHDDRLSRPVHAQGQPQSISYDQDTSKRAKVQAFAPTSVTSPGSHLRVPSEGFGLPGELWQHVFKFLPPVTLGCVLRVNKSFNLLLSPSQTELPVGRATPGAMKYVHPNAIWATSRKIFHTGMPRPLFSMTELDMWRLLLWTACQFCRKHASSPASGATPSESGLDENGVRVIWPFGVRACGECIQTHCEKVGVPQIPPNFGIQLMF